MDIPGPEPTKTPVQPSTSEPPLDNTAPSISPEPVQSSPMEHTTGPEPLTGGIEPATTHAATPPPPPAQPIVPPPPPATSAASGAEGKEPIRGQHNAGLIVMQWLTYAFWGWTVLGLSILTFMVLATFMTGANTGTFTPYGIAAILVLLPISYIVDSFYSKKEPEKKTGAETVVMVIHAVLFALFAIGSLICTVIALVQLFTERGDSTGVQVFLWGSLITTAYYVLTFLRVLSPGPLQFMRRIYKWIMLITVGIIALLGIIGPVARQRETRDDRLIESNLTSVQAAVDGYANRNKKLPDTLAGLEVNGDAKQLVDRNLVTYKPEGATSNLSNSYSNLGIPSSTTTNGVTRNGLYVNTTVYYRYQLCVTYKKESNAYSKFNYAAEKQTSEYQNYLSVYSHPQGNVCYKLQTTVY